MPRRVMTAGHLFMGYMKGESVAQGSLFPVLLDDLVPEDHPVRVIEAFVAALDLVELGFERAQPQAMGRPGYDPADLLKLYLYGYLNRIRSSRRLERECHRHVEVMWLLGRLSPDFKTVADFRRINGDAFVRVCRAFVRFCAKAKLLGAELVAIDGSKFQAASGKRGVVTAHALEEQNRQLDRRIEQYLTSLEVGEAESRLMRTAHGQAVAYNVQSAVDAKHGLIVHHEVTREGNDQSSLEPIAKAAQQVLGGGSLAVVADAGYANLTQFAGCEASAITPYVALKPGVNNQGGGRLYQPGDFCDDPKTDTYRCPADKILTLKQVNQTESCRIHAARQADCAGCARKPKRTEAARRYVRRHVHAEALERMAARLAAAPDMMKHRRALAEHPFAQIKCGVMGDGRFLLKGLRGARTEMALAVLARNLKRVMNLLGNRTLVQQLVHT